MAVGILSPIMIVRLVVRASAAKNDKYSRVKSYGYVEAYSNAAKN